MPSGVVKAMAFIDNGSDTTLCRTKQHRDPVIFTDDQYSEWHQGDQAKVKLFTLDNAERVDVTEAFTIADLPMRAVESIGQ
ncbi:unnamed protein product [Echinostoma caproni]|uniref:Peptidase A2 domain-containing protein n=1 Tax=Echinostoma caproni TaxID=27848 RepID=A0A183B852_9TREM|nr:unnamed protein product [Echinostoma caproni]